MSDSTSRVLSALAISVALVASAIVLAEPRYEGFSVESTREQHLHGVFDNQTGRVCYSVILSNVEGNEEGAFLRCSLGVE